jgi:antitoxin ParD1/3/4
LIDRSGHVGQQLRPNHFGPFLIALTASWKEDCKCYGSFSESDLKTIEETASCAISIHSSFSTIRDKLLVLAIFASRVTVKSKSTSMERTTAMPTRNVNLTDELDRFVAKKVKTGRYENASEVVRAGLRTLEREEQQYEAKIAALRAAIDAGDASGIAEGNVFGRVRKALKLPVSPR